MRALGGFEDIGAGFERSYQTAYGALGDFPQVGFQLGVGFFDWVHIRAVGRQISQLGPGSYYELFDPWPLVGGQIVHDDDVTLRERGNETFFHPFLEQGGVDRPVVDLRGDEATKAQARDECDCFIMAMRDANAQPSSSPAASAFAREIGGSASLVDEDEFCGIEIELCGEPIPALLQNVRALLLFGVRGLFLNVIP